MGKIAPFATKITGENVFVCIFTGTISTTRTEFRFAVFWLVFVKKQENP